MPDKTLKAFADHGRIGAPLPADGGDCEAVLAQLARAGINQEKLADNLQREGAQSFTKSWHALLAGIDGKRAQRAGKRAGARQ
jgi:transaldolase